MKIMYTGVKTVEQAKERAPWARIVFRIDEGFMCFENPVEAAQWFEMQPLVQPLKRVA